MRGREALVVVVQQAAASFFEVFFSGFSLGIALLRQNRETLYQLASAGARGRVGVLL